MLKYDKGNLFSYLSSHFGLIKIAFMFTLVMDIYIIRVSVTLKSNYLLGTTVSTINFSNVIFDVFSLFSFGKFSRMVTLLKLSPLSPYLPNERKQETKYRRKTKTEWENEKEN